MPLSQPSAIVEPELSHSLLDDESDSDEETMNMPFTRKYYRALNQKINMLVSHGEAFSISNFQNIMIVHEATVKILLYESKRLCEENEKLVKEHATKMEATINENYDTEDKIAHEHARKETQITSLKQEFMFVKYELEKMDDEMLLVKA
ncbi:unnamed protein product [Lactuca virosa]|uniref:Uncharacterized protein n=1 Tax=Lactuca virosa TaxID=75947 RepID=A0AAU9LUN9_9ASTR|nr:unnamed protein product [Lactuca virosa]